MQVLEFRLELLAISIKEATKKGRSGDTAFPLLATTKWKKPSGETQSPGAKFVPSGIWQQGSGTRSVAVPSSNLCVRFENTAFQCTGNLNPREPLHC